MTKQKYIEDFITKLQNMAMPEDYGLSEDENFLIHEQRKDEIYIYPIEKAVVICNFANELSDYLKSLKIGDKFYHRRFFGEPEEGIILKINHNKDKKISSITYRDKYGKSKIEKEYIVYKNIVVEDFISIYKMFKPTGYLFFTNYDIENANKIYDKITKNYVY